MMLAVSKSWKQTLADSPRGKAAPEREPAARADAGRKEIGPAHQGVAATKTAGMITFNIRRKNLCQSTHVITGVLGMEF
jgi:hypothetical protein